MPKPAMFLIFQVHTKLSIKLTSALKLASGCNFAWPITGNAISSFNASRSGDPLIPRRARWRHARSLYTPAHPRAPHRNSPSHAPTTAYGVMERHDQAARCGPESRRPQSYRTGSAGSDFRRKGQLTMRPLNFFAVHRHRPHIRPLRTPGFIRSIFNQHDRWGRSEWSYCG